MLTRTNARGGRLGAVVISLVAPLLGAAGTATADPGAARVTQLTVRTPTCRGCEVQLYQAIDGRTFVWHSRARKTTHGPVTFTVPTRRTHGLSIAVRAPWEGAVPFITMAVFRYRGLPAGTHVDLATARRQRHGSACWAGTERATKTFTVAVRKVRVQGNTGMVDGSIAWLPSQARTWDPMSRTRGGIYGAQEPVYCQRP